VNKEDKDRNRKKEREGMRNKCISLATECERIWKVGGRGRVRKERGMREGEGNLATFKIFCGKPAQKSTDTRMEMNKF